MKIYSKRNVFSLEPIPFDSVTKAILEYCSSENSLDQNYQNLRKKVAISQQSAYQKLSSVVIK